jgi:hypothetical protein
MHGLSGSAKATCPSRRRSIPIPQSRSWRIASAGNERQVALAVVDQPLQIDRHGAATSLAPDSQGVVAGECRACGWAAHSRGRTMRLKNAFTSSDTSPSSGTACRWPLPACASRRWRWGSLVLLARRLLRPFGAIGTDNDWRPHVLGCGPMVRTVGARLGRVPVGGVGAVGKWPAGATAKGLT